MISRLFTHRPGGVHLRGSALEPRVGKGREFNQIGRRIAEAKAVKSLERKIDQTLGHGTGRKLLKEVGKDTGGIYGKFGSARITGEQRDRALAEAFRAARTPEKTIGAPARVEQGTIAADAAVSNQKRAAEQARLRKHALSGETVGFRLAEDDDTALHQELMEDFAKADPKAGAVDPQFQKDKHRLTSLNLMEGGTVVRDLSGELHETAIQDHAERDGIVADALSSFARISEGEDDETVAKRAFYLSVLGNQRTIASAYTRTTKMLGGQVAAPDNIVVNLQKFKDQDGNIQFGVHLTTRKLGIKGFGVDQKVWNEKQREWQDVMEDFIETERDASSLFVDQDLQISAVDLANGNSKGLKVRPVEITGKMSRV